MMFNLDFLFQIYLTIYVTKLFTYKYLIHYVKYYDINHFSRRF